MEHVRKKDSYIENIKNRIINFRGEKEPYKKGKYHRI